VQEELTKLLEISNVYYFRKLSDAPENLNEFIETDTSVRVPVAGSEVKAYYYEMEIDRKLVRKGYRLRASNLFLERSTLREIVNDVITQKTGEPDVDVQK